MQIGIVGLGKMGYNLALNLAGHGHRVIGYDPGREKTEEGIELVNSLPELVRRLAPRRVIWIMVPAGETVDHLLNELVLLVSPQDIIVDGGNSNYKDTLRRSAMLKDKGLSFVDVGTSGGVEGARHGVCAMVGAEKEAFDYLEPVFRDISVENGYLHVGPNGSGHFVKMIHNGIEYGMMQAIGEGFEILARSQFNLNLEEIARLFNNGSVIRSWLIELLARSLAKDANLEKIRGVMHSSGEGLWTAQTALEMQVPAPVITTSLLMRFRSLQEDSFAGKVVAALRNEFGGHAVVSGKKTD
ncbi:MAG: decarboxylating 6-phosphogluconate dehydrogenase [Syntrophomonadaceae bacterium]|nr:decarboxylating 6-phosphogluconate dehydrogenase [Syntrophomonadaceae bacterium]